MGLITNPLTLVVGETVEKAVEMLEDIGVLYDDVRVLGPNQAGTCEFRPNRLNLYIDETGLVTEASYG